MFHQLLFHKQIHSFNIVGRKSQFLIWQPYDDRKVTKLENERSWCMKNVQPKISLAFSRIIWRFKMNSDVSTYIPKYLCKKMGGQMKAIFISFGLIFASEYMFWLKVKMQQLGWNIWLTREFPPRYIYAILRATL